MPTTIKLKNSVTTTNAPSSLVQGEVAINITDKKVWVGNAATTPIQLLGDGGSASFTSIAFGAGTVSNPSITFTGDTNTGIYSPAADTIAFTEGGVESMRIDSNGDVGIGTTNPTYKLDITDATTTTEAGGIRLTLGSEARSHLITNTLQNAASGRDLGVLAWRDLVLTAGNGTTEGILTGNAKEYVTFKTGSGFTERMRIDSSGNVGIGTSSPSATLDVRNTSNEQIRFGYTGTPNYCSLGRNSGTGNFNIFVNSAEPLLFGTNNTERMRIDSSGNVGIGTSSFVWSNAGRGLLEINGSTDSLIALKSNNTTQMYMFASTSIAQINATANIPMAFYTNGTERMRITSGGNVGIGTSTPSGPLTVSTSEGVVNVVTQSNEVNINVRANQTKNCGITFTENAIADRWTIGCANADQSFIFRQNASSMTTGTERMRLTGGGILLVNTTTGQLNTEIAAFTNTGGGSICLRIQRSGENNAYIGTSTAQPFQVWDSGVVQRFVVTSGGSCQNTTGSYGTISDAKLKENIVDATPKLADLMQVKVRNFNLKTNPDLKQIGFVAQELRDVFPSMIEESEDEDENGQKTGEVTLGVKTTVLIPILVKAIQEQQAMIEELKQEVALLKSK